MWLLSSFWFLLVNRISNRICNHDAPSCVDCVHFVEEKKFNNPINMNQYGKCSIFGQKDVVTGQIQYEYALTCRNNQCGVNGTFFEAKNSSVHP